MKRIAFLSLRLYQNVGIRMCVECKRMNSGSSEEAGMPEQKNKQTNKNSSAVLMPYLKK